MLSKDEVKALALRHANMEAAKRPDNRAYNYREISGHLLQSIQTASMERNKIDVDEVKGRNPKNLSWKRSKKPLLDKFGKK